LTETYVGDDFDYIKSVSLMIGDASGKKGQYNPKTYCPDLTFCF